MNLDQLGRTLRDMYDGAAAGEKTTQIHLFGVKYAAAITDGRFAVREVVQASGIRSSYQTEVAKGMRLSRYVTVRREYQD